MPEMSLQEQFELPLVKDLISENDSLRQTANLEGTKIPDSKIENIKVPYIIKNKLLMKEGDFNGVHYPKAAIMEKVEEANEKGLILDHLDTQNQGASAWTGQVLNAHWGTGDEGEGLYGDLSIVDKSTAQKLAQGAKWGISPTIDFEKNDVDGKIVASDLLWKSFSFVINPAVRDTMLNNKQEVVTMPEENKTIKHPYPANLSDKGARGANAEEQLEVDEKTLAVLEAKDAELKELREMKTKIDTAKKEELISTLTSNEFLIGRISDDEMSDRAKTLMEKSTEVLGELAEMVGDHAELSAFTDFVKTFMKKNKGATIAQAAKAFKAKGKENLEDKPGEGKADPAGDDVDGKGAAQAQLTGMPDSSMNGKETAELSDKAGIKIEDTDVEMFNFLASQQPGGAQ